MLCFIFSAALTLSGTEFASKPQISNLPQIETAPAKAAKGWKEVPYTEDNPVPEFTDTEKRTGMMIFTRPVTEPIYPQTRPAPWERTEKLCTFAAQGQIAMLNFAVFPTRELKGLTATAEYPFKDAGELRQVSYENYRYPHYTTVGSFRRMPGYMIPAGKCNLANGEPLRYVLNLRIPANAKPGVYHGKVMLWHSGFDKAVVLPYSVKVLPYQLSRDPEKHITAYAYNPRQLPKGREHKNDEEWLKKASVNDFRLMKEYGFTCPPTLTINYDPKNGGRFYLSNIDKLQKEWTEAGIKAPRIIALGGFTSQLYRKYTGKSYNKRKMETLPEEFYKELERLAGDFKKEYDKSGLPELYLLAVDEPTPVQLEYVKKIYQALKRAGFKTFITSCPFKKEVAEWVDIWLDQFFEPLEIVQKSPKAEHWCYPNHNAFEQKDTPIMTRGGRMTYGFGFWRSGYTAMVPWMWSWGSGKSFPGIAYGGQILNGDGSELIEWEWESFREGIIDGAYIYTLQEAIVRRENTHDPKLKALLAQSRKLLQNIWNSIPVEPKYLADNHWQDNAFDTRRLELASMIAELKKYPETNQKKAPSILADTKGKFVRRDIAKFFSAEEKAGNLFRKPIPESAWKTNWEKEGRVSVTPEGIVDFRIDVDHKFIGNSNGYYQGTPSLAAVFPEKQDMTPYAFLSYKMKVSSNRHLVENVKWPHSLLFFSVNDSGKSVIGTINPPTSVEPDIWHSRMLMLNTSLGQKEMSRIARFWFYFREGHYAHGDKLCLQLKDVALIGAKRPIVQTLAADSLIASTKRISWQARLFGKISAPVEAELTLYNAKGKVIEKQKTRIDRNTMGGTFICKKPLAKGTYTLGIKLFESNKAYQSVTCQFKAVEL